MLFADQSAGLSAHRFTADGFLVAEVKFARTGIQIYTGQEVDRPDLATVFVARPVEEVFDADALRSFAGKPLTMGHPPEGVTSDTWRNHTIGRIGDEVWRDGDFIRSTIIVQDASAISLVRAGTRELSAGYSCELEWQEGAMDGQRFHAIHRHIRGNHLAIVDRARAGAACRIGIAA